MILVQAPGWAIFRDAAPLVNGGLDRGCAPLPEPDKRLDRPSLCATAANIVALFRMTKAPVQVAR